LGALSSTRRGCGEEITTLETFGRSRVWPRRLAGDSEPCYEVCQVSLGDYLYVFFIKSGFSVSGCVSSSFWSGDYFRPTCYPHMPRSGSA
jgi:hypothetical protein